MSGLDMSALAQQILGGQQGGPPQGFGPQDQGPPQDPSQGGGQPVEIIKQIVQLCQQFLQAEPDEEDKLQGAKLLQLAQQLLAKDQQDRDSALGGSNQRILRKAG